MMNAYILIRRNVYVVRHTNGSCDLFELMYYWLRLISAIDSSDVCLLTKKYYIAGVRRYFPNYSDNTRFIFIWLIRVILICPIMKHA